MLPLLQSAKTLSAFQQCVLSALELVPEGKVTTYAALADSIDCASPRAVGQALRQNPFSPEVPCHRVVRSDGSLGGFFGSTTLTAEKIRLLAAEGVRFDPSGRVMEHFILRTLKKDHLRQSPCSTLPTDDAK